MKHSDYDYKCNLQIYEERIILPAATVTIEVSGGLVQNVYASPDLPEIHVELLDFDNLKEESAKADELENLTGGLGLIGRKHGFGMSHCS